ncbi:hypothetical protein DAPPUDRAFT_320435 [Daphnia pulex]|uniref:Uncharacterized protein n=1 Tax=Daphnia pulex TaxID=6669 RepID=E9GPU3_DAPPU|nr:hypothetical protein DAPPUDRAFT_320435 [Daphnia pulex]|eukprot:EFX78527.1 hypothetical protein DAPPUDRAFT_320435 [Daphnia pulex]
MTYEIHMVEDGMSKPLSGHWCLRYFMSTTVFKKYARDNETTYNNVHSMI